MSEVLEFRSGHRVEVVADLPEVLRLRHTLPAPGRQAGPHRHPVLAETWTVTRGRLRFVIDGTATVAGPGDTVHAPPGAVHAFESLDPGTELDHEIRPPLRHLDMFRLWSALDRAGRTTRSGIPRDPLALALLWQLQDGYLAGPPEWLQRVFLGGAARLAVRLGYQRRLLPGRAAP
ncbi:cupin domain-containing protein [Nocardia sp. NPDC057227]|uniref:cupin domain-containing protein n=1 Tax=Nocardia sp. NPDC057227 TaxID=3346056 RepID=UPI0036332CB6